MLTIGEVARRCGVATSALRYWEELGLLTAPERVSGRRRYPESAITQVGAILLRRDAGFSLAEQKALIGARSEQWREIHRRKLAELDEQIAQTQMAREAISHGLECPYENPLECPNFVGLVAARLEGRPLQEAHAALR